MSKIAESFLTIAQQAERLVAKTRDPAISDITQRIRGAANQVAKAWSGSPLGYHSRVYYENFCPPPPGAVFSMEWGMIEAFSGGTLGNWIEYPFDVVREYILELAGNVSMQNHLDLSAEGKAFVTSAKEALLSNLIIASKKELDPFLLRMREQIEKIETLSARGCAEVLIGKRHFSTRDMIAMNQGIQFPPHHTVIGELVEIQSNLDNCFKVETIARQIAGHFQNLDNFGGQTKMGTKVFIGHGRSPIWRDLKDFLQDRLDLLWDEFNRVPVAGITNIERLRQMLDDATIAFLIMTAEDEQADGTLQARMNVIHEAGLFQGRLGFNKAIILIEENCKEFSNITGLGQIRFPRGNIAAKFEEIRRVLEREYLVKT